MGKLGRGLMAPLIRRQYDLRGALLNRELKRHLFWWRNAIGLLHPRSVPLALLAPMAARSDAQGHGRIAARAHTHTHLPP